MHLTYIFIIITLIKWNINISKIIVHIIHCINNIDLRLLFLIRKICIDFKVSNFKNKIIISNYSKKNLVTIHISFESRFLTSFNKMYFSKLSLSNASSFFYILPLYRIFTIWKHDYIAIVTIKLISHNYQLRFPYINYP